jgi:hypothetical protein
MERNQCENARDRNRCDYKQALPKFQTVSAQFSQTDIMGSERRRQYSREFSESNAHAQRISRKTIIMKPTFPTITSSPRGSSFELSKSKRASRPLTDYNYHSVHCRNVSGRYAHNCVRSFWNITGDYSKNEARYDFWGEAALWAVLTLTAFLPLISNARAVMEFLRAIGGY